MDETLFKVLLGLVAVLATIITGFIVPFIKSKIDAATLDKIVAWVTYAVKCAEMIYKESGMGKEKKQYVVDFIDKFVNSKKTVITKEQLDVLIESAVEELNANK